jgi:hypothetical protein
MFAIRPLVQEKYPMRAMILGHLGSGLREQMQITLVSYPDLLVFALVFSLIFLQNIMFYDHLCRCYRMFSQMYREVRCE